MIPIKNIYYMLTYAFRVLQESGFKKIETENFENMEEMLSSILTKGIKNQIRNGLNRDYIDKEDSIFTIKGKINIDETIKTNSIVKSQVVCRYTEFTENSYFNRILKTTIIILLKMDMSAQYKKELRKLLLYFQEVDVLDINNINWHLQFNRNNQTYYMLIAICNMIIKGFIHTQQTGNKKLMNYFDEQKMHHLYEKFIFEYYRKHHKEIIINSEQIDWQLDNDYKDMLPIMQTDMILRLGNNYLILDAKYYSKNTQHRFNSNTLHSSNLYQIFTYVKNKEEELKNVEHKVSGLLLYALPDEGLQLNNEYKMSGNLIAARTINLNCEFNEIKKQLEDVINHFFKEYV